MAKTWDMAFLPGKLVVMSEDSGLDGEGQASAARSMRSLPLVGGGGVPTRATPKGPPPASLREATLPTLRGGGISGNTPRRLRRGRRHAAVDHDGLAGHEG